MAKPYERCKCKGLSDDERRCTALHDDDCPADPCECPDLICRAALDVLKQAKATIVPTD